MFSYFKPNFIKKFLWKSGFSNVGQNRKWREIKIGYLAAILKRYNIFTIFGRIVIFYSPYIYGANFIAKFRWQSGFLNPPWAPTGVKYLGHLCVKAEQHPGVIFNNVLISISNSNFFFWKNQYASKSKFSQERKNLIQIWVNQLVFKALVTMWSGFVSVFFCL